MNPWYFWCCSVTAWKVPRWFHDSQGIMRPWLVWWVWCWCRNVVERLQRLEGVNISKGWVRVECMERSHVAAENTREHRRMLRMKFYVTDNLNVGPQPHEIKISYHPASKCPEQRFSFDENLPGVSAFTRSQSSDQAAAKAPWHPFRSWLDFEIAELSLNAHLSKMDTEHLLSIICQCIETPDQFTLSSHKDLSE